MAGALETEPPVEGLRCAGDVGDAAQQQVRRSRAPPAARRAIRIARRADAASLVAPVDQEPPQVRVGQARQRLGDHHEAGEPAVGRDRPVPRHERFALVLVGHQRVAVRLGDRRHELVVARTPDRARRTARTLSRVISTSSTRFDRLRRAPCLPLVGEDLEPGVVLPGAAHQCCRRAVPVYRNPHRSSTRAEARFAGIERGRDAMHLALRRASRAAPPTASVAYPLPWCLGRQRVADHRERARRRRATRRDRRPIVRRRR